MKRLSRATLTARDSIFAGGPDLYRGDIQAICPPSLTECVSSLEECCEQAYDAHQLLRNGTSGLPRITKILENERVFLLVDDATVKRYKAELIDEVEPAINQLLERAEDGLKALHRKESQLRTKVESARSRPLRPTEGTTIAAQKLEQRRLHMLKKQREKLEIQIASLEAELAVMET